MTFQDRLQRLQESLDKLLERSGRSLKELTLIAVSKYASIEQIQLAYDCGMRHFGESRIQQALGRIEQLPDDIQWHLIGTLQRNKVSKIRGLFSYIHSIDSVSLAETLSKVSEGLSQKILVQVNTANDPNKHGFTEEELKRNWDQLIALPHLHIVGLMTMAPLTDNEKKIRKCFASLRKLRDHLQTQSYPLPELSMGMSGDYRIAIEEGATMIRIGSLLFHDNQT